MDWYFAALITGALVALVLAWDIPRAPLWIGMGAASFVASSMWQDAGLPYGAAFGASTNFVVCFALYALAELRWEMRVWNCFHLMILLDILYLAGFIKSHFDFAVGLEIANWLALIVIGATGLTEGNGLGVLHGGGYRDRPGFFHRALYSKRKKRPFWDTPG